MTETDPDAVQAATGRWLAARSPAPAALAADGKRHRGANRQSEAEYQTVSLVSHHDKQPIASRILTEKGGEIAAVLALLEEVDITGSVITLDALHTTRDTAAAILHSHRAHYLLSVKGNAPETYAALDTIDWDQDATASFCEEPTSKGHGRIDQRHIQTMEPISGMLNYPQVKQVFASSATATRSRPGSIPAKWRTASPRCPPSKRTHSGRWRSLAGTGPSRT